MELSLESIESAGLGERVSYALEHHFQDMEGSSDRYAFTRRVLSCLAEATKPLSCAEIGELLGMDYTWVQKRIYRLLELTESWSHEFGFRLSRTEIPKQRGFDLNVYSLERVDPWEPTERQLLKPAVSHEDEVERTLDDSRKKHLKNLLETFGVSNVDLVPKIPAREARLLLGHATRNFEPYDRPEMAIVKRVWEARERGNAVSIAALRREFDIPSSARQLPNKIEKKSLGNVAELGFFMECGDGHMSMEFLDPTQRRALLERKGRIVENDFHATLTEPVIPNYPEFRINTFRRRLKAAAGLLDEKQKALFAAVAEAQEAKSFRNGPEVAALVELPVHRIVYRVPQSQKVRKEVGMYLRYRGNQDLECMLLGE